MILAVVRPGFMQAQRRHCTPSAQAPKRAERKNRVKLQVNMQLFKLASPNYGSPYSGANVLAMGDGWAPLGGQQEGHDLNRKLTGPATHPMTSFKQHSKTAHHSNAILLFQHVVCHYYFHQCRHMAVSGPSLGYTTDRSLPDHEEQHDD